LRRTAAGQVHVRRFFVPQPEQLRIAPQPCQLALCVLPRGEPDGVRGLLRRRLAAHGGHGLAQTAQDAVLLAGDDGTALFGRFDDQFLSNIANNGGGGCIGALSIIVPEISGVFIRCMILHMDKAIIWKG
jgi:hypothetical protein